MTPQEIKIDEWELEAIQKLYWVSHELKLSTDQARQVYDFEQLRDMGSGKYFFSIWEELDFECAYFQNILTPRQFEDYKINQQKLILFNEQQLAQQDQDYVKQLQAAKDFLQYYESNLLPNLEKQRMNIWPAFYSEKEKISYLKDEYKKHLDNRKKFILVEHFRHSKTLQPQLLQLSLLNHKLFCLVPDYLFFRTSMDEPTKAIADHLDIKIKRIASSFMEGLSAALNELKEFTKDNAAKHLGEIKGWHCIKNEEDNPIVLLLLDRNKYGS